MKLTKFFAFLFATLTFAACSDGKTDEPSEPTTPASGITLTADKTTVEKLQKDFKKFKYEALPMECAEKAEKPCCNHKH